MVKTKQTGATITTSVRADVRDLAVVAKWLDDNGKTVFTLGELVRLGYSLFAQLVKDKPEVEEIELVSEALDVLEGFGLRSKNKPLPKGLIKSMQIEAGAIEQLQHTGPRIIASNDIANIADDIARRAREESAMNAEMKKITLMKKQNVK